VVASTVFGSIVEWYDFYIYGTAAALVFGKLFFPTSDPFVATIAALLTFAVGLFARPFGAVLFGHFGDRIGRKSVMLFTMILMGVPTVLIGCLPTYATVGVWAPVMLVTLRIVQGLALGGEWGGAVLMAVEHAPGHRKSVFGSLPQMGVPAGVLLSAGVFALVTRMPEADFLEWGWRLPFLISSILIGFAIFVRMRIQESPEFELARKEERIERIPIVAVLKRNMPAVALAAGAKLGEVTLFFLTTVYLVSYCTGKLGLPRDFVLGLVVSGAALALVNMPIAGWLGDRFGARRIYVLGAVLLAIVSFPMFFLLETKAPVAMAVAFIVPIGFVFPLMFGPQPSLYSKQFPAELRYSGMSLGVSLASAAGGGLAPVIATTLVQSSGNSLQVGYYMAGMALVSAVSAYMMKRA